MPVAAHGLADDADEAAAIAAQIGFPVAVKLCSREVLHKSDVGGVVLGVADADGVRAAFAQVRAALARCRDASGRPPRFEGVLVARMVRGRGELMVGVRRDPVFGPVALAGIGGTAVEVLRQTAFGTWRRCRRHARADMLARSRAAALCESHRGHAPLDLDAIAEVLVRVSRCAVALGERLDTLEINPFIIGADGFVRGRRRDHAAATGLRGTARERPRQTDADRSPLNS